MSGRSSQERGILLACWVGHCPDRVLTLTGNLGEGSPPEGRGKALTISGYLVSVPYWELGVVQLFLTPTHILQRITLRLSGVEETCPQSRAHE